MYPVNPSPLLRLQGLDPLAPKANGGGGGKAPKPDKNIGLAAMKTAELGEETLQWYKDMYEQDSPYRETVRELSAELATTQIDAAKQNQAIADDYYSYMKGTFRPMEQGIVDSAQNFATEAEQNRQASAAAADIARASANQRGQRSRQLAAMGVNPNSGRFVALDQDASISEAALRAGAMTKARTNADQQGWARKMDAASLGRNLPGSQATSQGIALAAGRGALDSAGAPAQNTALYGQLMQQGFGSAIAGNKAAGDMYNQQYQSQLQGWSAQQAAASQQSGAMWGAAGTAIGMYAMYAL